MSLTFITLILYTAISSYAAVPEKLPNGLEIPPCPQGSQRFNMPNPQKPLWVGCKDQRGLFQGLLFQFSIQGEMVRVASVRDSNRHGREIRFGDTGHLEDRGYHDGHLQGESQVYRSDLVLQRVLPKTMQSKDWLPLIDWKMVGVLGQWLKAEPASVVTFDQGRMVRLRFASKDYRFSVTRDGRILSLNHPEMKQQQYFIDPSAIWNLGADDLKKAILPGFGSCKKYSGPIGRFGRHYDHLMYNRQVSETKHRDELAEIRERFLRFCVPEDVRQNLGVVECPPQLPGMVASGKCLLPISDQLKIPYHPKFFKYEFGVKFDPATFIGALDPVALRVFMATPDRDQLSKFFPPKTLVVIKKKGNRLVARIFSDRKPGVKPGPSDLEDRNWWEWHTLPGFE